MSKYTPRRDYWSCEAREAGLLNSLCLELLYVLWEQGYISNQQKTNTPCIPRQKEMVHVDKDLHEDGCTPLQVRLNIPGAEYLWLSFGHIPQNCPQHADAMFEYYAPISVVAGGINMWLEPIEGPRIFTYVGNDWSRDCAEFGAWTIERRNKNFKHHDKLMQVETNQRNIVRSLTRISESIAVNTLCLADTERIGHGL